MPELGPGGSVGPTRTGCRRSRSAGDLLLGAPGEGQVPSRHRPAVICASAGPAPSRLRAAGCTPALRNPGARWRQRGRATTATISNRWPASASVFDEESTGVLPNAQLRVAAAAAHRAALARHLHHAGPRFGRRRRTLAVPACCTPGDDAVAAAGTLLRHRAGRARLAGRVGRVDGDAAGDLTQGRALAQPAAGATHALSLLSPLALRRLAQQHPEATLFCNSNAHGAFVGASPEQLVGSSMARCAPMRFAGTAWAGQPLLIDKNTHEQQLVVEGYAARWRRCATRFTCHRRRGC